MTDMKVLIVDDREDDVHLLQTLFEKSGYRVVTARNGIQALDELKKESVDLIISDILMPKMDGFHLCRECKKNDELRKIPFVFYTATYTDRKDEELALHSGADKYIIKPTEPDMFLRIIEDVIKDFRERTLVPGVREIDLVPGVRESEEEETYLAEYNTRLVNKLDKKVQDLERTHKKLTESEQRYRELVNHINDVVIFVDPDGRLEFVNPKFCTVFDYSDEEVKLLDFDSLIHPEDLPQIAEKIEQMLQGEANTAVYEARFLKKSGETFYGDCSCAPIRRDDGIAGVLGVVRDITRRKETEKQLAEYQHHLEELVGERTRELEQANIRLQELDSLKSMFIATMSHELRTPLNSIIGFTKIVLNEWCGTINAEQRENLSVVLRSSKHLLALINDLIDISLIEAGKMEPHIIDFDLHDIISEAVNTFSVEIEEKDLEVSVDSIYQPMHTDRQRLLQCLLNLISNAVKFTEKGEITIRAVLCGEATEGGARFVEVSVEDTGIGIKDADIPKLFSAFVRIESPLSSKVVGTGLGLYLTKKLVTEILKGEVRAASRYGHGSTFSMRIPVTLQ